MKTSRRELLKYSSVALIPGTVLSKDQPAQHDKLSWTHQPHYHVLYVFMSHPVDDFVPVGIYTRKQDALNHQKAIADSLGLDVNVPNSKCGCIVERSHEELCYELANNRLGAMAEQMRKLMGQPIPRNNYGVDKRRYMTYADLYGKPEFEL